MGRKNKQTKEQIAVRISVRTIIGNMALTVFKLFAGFASGSTAMIADGVHSASDVLSTVVVIIGVKLAAKASDKDHPYGHERMEPIAAMILAGMLCATGLGIGYSGILKIIQKGSAEIAVPGTLALAAAIVSILVKEAMFWYVRAPAKKIGSGALMADAWHHRSDALSSIGSFAGILGARLGFPVLDPLASVIICLFIVKASYDIFKDAVSKMTDRACDDETVKAIGETVLRHGAVLGIDMLKTRLFGDKIYVDMEISVNGDIKLKEAHDIAERIHDDIESEFPKVKHCMVHINPR